MKIEMQLSPIGGVEFPEDVAWQMNDEILFLLDGELVDLDSTFDVEYMHNRTDLLDPIKLTIRFLSERAMHIINMSFPITTELKEAIKRALLFSGNVKIKEKQGWE